MQKIITERPNLFEPNDYITFYVELSGKVRTKDLADAVKAAYRANEATMSKIVLRSDGVSYYEKLPQSNCRVEIIQGEWQDIIRTNEKKPFALEKGELVRCFILPAGEAAAFIVMAHHLAGDGKAVIYLIESILEALSGKAPAYKPLTLLTQKAVSQTGKFPAAVKLYVKSCNRKWVKRGKPTFSWDDYYHIHECYWKTTSSWIQCRQFSKEETMHIIENAKRLGVSVNSYIIAAFLRADSSNRSVGIPVSVREDGNKSMTNLTSGIRILHSYADTGTFAGNAKQIQKKVAKELAANRFFVLRFLSELAPPLIDGVLLYTHHCYENPLMERLAKVMKYTGEKVRELGITNLTVLDIPSVYGTVKLEKIVFIPPNVSYAHHIIGVSTFHGEMTVTYHGTEEKREEEKKFFDRGIENLVADY